MSKSETNVLLGLVAMAALLYFGTKAKADQGSGRGAGGVDDDGQGGAGGTFIPGGGDSGGHGVTGSWLTFKDPIL